MNERSIPLDAMMPLMKQKLESGGFVTFSPRGTSMEPMLRQDRDSVTLSPAPRRLKKYDLPLYRRENGQYVLHRIVKGGDPYTCMGDNQFLPEPGIRHDQIIGIVTTFTRKGKTCPVTALRYRLYCRFWHYSRPLRRLWRHFTRSQKENPHETET